MIYVDRNKSVNDKVAFEFTKEFYKLILSQPNVQICEAYRMTQALMIQKYSDKKGEVQMIQIFPNHYNERQKRYDDCTLLRNF